MDGLNNTSHCGSHSRQLQEVWATLGQPSQRTRLCPSMMRCRATACVISRGLTTTTKSSRRLFAIALAIWCLSHTPSQAIRRRHHHWSMMMVATVL